MWFLLALGSAVFAALTSILARNRRCRIESGYCDPYDGCRSHGMGNGIDYASASRNKRHQPEKLVFPDPVRPCYWCLMALLLQGFADGRSFQSRSD